jgi:peroxiredoxin
LTEEVIALAGFFLATAACMNDPAYWKFIPPESIYFPLRPATRTIEPSSHAYTRRLPAPIMSAMASKDTTRTARIGDSLSRPRMRLPMTSSCASSDEEAGSGRARLGDSRPRRSARSTGDTSQAGVRLAREGSGRVPTRPDPDTALELIGSQVDRVVRAEQPEMSESNELVQRLVGRRVPAQALPFAPDANAVVSLATLAYRRSLVVFFYPGIEPPAASEGEEDVDRTRAAAWSERDPELEKRGYMVVGVSTQPPDVQARFATDALVAYMLLSDSELLLAGELRLPTACVDGREVYEPLTLIVRDGRIAHVLYPVDVARETASVLDWIEADE